MTYKIKYKPEISEELEDYLLDGKHIAPTFYTTKDELGAVDTRVFQIENVFRNLELDFEDDVFEDDRKHLQELLEDGVTYIEF